MLEYLIYNFFLVFIIYKGMNVIFDKDNIYNKNIEIISYSIYYILISIIYLKIGLPIIMLLSNIIGNFIIQFNYKTKIKDKLLITMYIYLILLGLDLFNSIVLNKLQVSLFSKLFNFEETSFITIFIQLIVSLIILKSTKNFKNMKFKINMPKVFWLPLIVVPVFSIMLLVLITNNNKLYYIDLILIIFTLILFNICIFILYNYIVEFLMKKEEQYFLEQQYLSYISQFELIKENYEGLNMIKHDIRKHFIYIRELLINKNYNECLVYINELNTNEEILNIDNNIVKTNNICIDTIINLKLNEAIKNNIKIETDIKIPYNLDMAIYSSDIVCLLGNLLDNAIEANLKLEDEERYIYLKIKYYKEKLFIYIKNKYYEILTNENGDIISSKINRKEKYGVGTKIINKIINKYNGVKDIKYFNNIFELYIILEM